MNAEIDYEKVFVDRGWRYLRALNRYPSARAEEFNTAAIAARVEPGQRVVDVPAGGGMLANYLPEACSVTRLECAPGFSSGDQLRSHARADYSRWPLADACVDRVISVAGVHHVEDKRPFFNEIARCLAPAGVLLLAEVAEGSVIDRFLDGFINKHNPLGHQGFYLNDQTLVDLRQAGLEIESVTEQAYHWNFDSTEELCVFCSDQFGLRSLDHDQFVEELSEYLPLEIDSLNQIKLPWVLRHIRAIKAS